MLDEDADEAFHRPENRAVQQHGRLAAVVLVDVFGAETHRQVEVELDGAALPQAAERVLQRELDLRPVERALARLQIERQAIAFECGGKRGLRPIPGFVRADPLFRAG